jgi:ubiquitin carboxyl-terminal hydrolase 34
MTHIDLTLPPSPEDQPRHCLHGRYSLTNAEVEFIRPIGRNKDLLLLKKILEQQSNPHASKKITSIFLDAEPEFGLTEAICKVLEEGLRVAPAELCIPFLDATLVFCQFSTDIDRIRDLIDCVAKGVDSINNSAGREHLIFFQSLVTAQNERLGKDQFWFWVVERIPDWAPTLLHYPEKVVRNNTFEFLRQLLFSKEHDELSEEFRQFFNKVARELAQACVEKLRRSYLMRSGPQSSVDARTLDTITLVITHCTEVYFDENENDEDGEFIQQATGMFITWNIRGL